MAIQKPISTLENATQHKSLPPLQTIQMKTLITALFFLASCHLIHSQDILLLKTSGKVIIGDTTQITTPGDYNLYVQHGILTEKVKVSLYNTADWSDDEWDNTPSLAEVAQSIINKKHLPSMPSAVSLVENGYDVTSMDSKLLREVEWLWQHTIRLAADNEALRKRIEALEAR